MSFFPVPTLHKDWSDMKMTKVFSKISLVKSSKNNFIFLSVFYLIICLMKAPKSFGKRGILKTWELVSLGGAKIHFGKIAMKWYTFRHEKKMFLTNIML